MGDPSAPALDLSKLIHSERVIDYAHSSERSSALDVALSASCRLFISSSSGLLTVAKAFGVPALYINCPLYKGFPHDHKSIFVPPFYFSYKKKRVLAIDEILSSNLVHADNQPHFVKAGIILKHVDPLDMVSVIDEALSFADGIDDELSETALRFEKINQANKTYINGRISSVFANKHRVALGL